MDGQTWYSIQKIAELVRERLELTLPITSEKLIEGISKIDGRCIPDVDGILGRKDASVFELNKEEDGYEFEILYNVKCSEQGKTFAIARELGRFLIN